MYFVLALTICGIDIIKSVLEEKEIYAMTYNVKSAGLYVGVNTVGTQNLNNNDETELQKEADIHNDTYALLEQGIERNAEQAINIQAPELMVNGLRTKFRGEIELCKRDENILNRIVEAEAGGEDISGKMLVANVVINRMKSEEYPDSVKGVVFEKTGGNYQFSPIRDGRYYTVKISPATKKAVKRVLAGEDNSDGARYFMCRKYSAKSSTKWFDCSLQYLFTHGCHEFFK